MNKVEYVKALRDLADYVEARNFPDKWVGWWNNEDSFEAPKLEIKVNSREDFGRLCAAMGSYDKERDSYHTGAKLKLETGATVKVYADRDVVCNKIVVGTRIVPATPQRIVEAEPERQEEIVEWECPESFLALKPAEVPDEPRTEVPA